MGLSSADQIARRAVELELLTDQQVQQVMASFKGREPTPEEFGQALMAAELLTRYQWDRLLEGETTGFFYGEYKVQYLVGTGTFARVFRAIHRKSGQVVALKVLRQRFCEMPAQSALFLREGELGCTLRHPNIVAIYEVHSFRNVLYLVMEFVEGHSLREFMNIRKVLEPLEATRLMIDIASGLDYAFQRKVTHRDLKLSNVLVSMRGQAKLVDFGLAGMDDALAENAIIEMPNTRTVDYAALERISGSPPDDPRSDIYFAGCIYYHMLCGKPPLAETSDRAQRMSRQRFLNVIPLENLAPQLPRQVINIVTKAMALDPVYRYQTPREMLVDLHRVAMKLSDEQGGHHTGESGGAQARPRTVMIVESNARMQEIFREGLKKVGYRILLTSDPERAFERARQDIGLMDGLLINAQEIGEPALEVFNRLGEDPDTRDLPCLLLLDEPQHGWKNRASTAGHRMVLCMPITMRQLRATLEKLVPARQGDSGVFQPSAR